MQTVNSHYPQTAPKENNNNTRQQALVIIIALLILLWSYTAGSKLIDVQQFKQELFNQTFSKNIAIMLLWFTPIAELLAAALLIIQKTRLLGLILSMILMTLFTGYISLVLLDYYDHVPCSCGGVLKALGWEEHFYFNLFFLSISSIGIYLQLNTNKDKLTNTNT